MIPAATAILARASAVGTKPPGQCPLCLRPLFWDRFETGLGLSCSDRACRFARWFDNAELAALLVPPTSA